MRNLRNLRHLPFVVAVLAATAVGCAALVGLGEYEIDDGKSGATGGGDGASSASDGVAPFGDGSSGSGNGDGDGGTEPPDDTPHFCTLLDAQPTFCADFDVPTDPNPTRGWDPLALDAGATIETVTDRAMSPPRSLHGRSTLKDLAVVSKTFPGPKAITVEADVLLAKLPADGSATAMIAIQPRNDPEMHIWYFVSGDKGNHYFQRGSDEFSPRGAPKYPAFEPGKWRHVSMTVRFTTTGTRIDARVDDVTYWTDHLLGRLWSPGTPVTVLAGVIPYNSTTAEAWVDNVVVRTE